MKKFLLLFFSFLICCSATAIVYPEVILNKKYSVQALALDSICNKLSHEDTSKIISQYDELESWAEKNGDLQLKYEFILKYNKYLISKGRQEKTIETSIQNIAKLADETGFVYLKADALQYLASYYWNTKNYTSSLEYFINAHSVYVDFPLADFPEKFNYIYDYGGKFYYFRDFNMAKDIFISALKQMTDEQLGNNISKINTVGLCFTYLQLYDSAIYYYHLADKYARSKNQEIWIGIISGNLSRAYLQQNRIDLAVPLLKKNIELSRKHHEMSDLTTSLSGMIEIYVTQKKYKEAMGLATEVLSIANSRNLFEKPEIVARVYPSLAKAFAANGNSSLAYRFLDLAVTAKESVEKQHNLLFISGAQHQVDAERHKSEMKKKEMEIDKQKFFRNSFIAGFFIVVLFIFILYKRITDKQKANRLLDKANHHLSELNEELVTTMDNLKATQQQLIQSEKLATVGSIAARMAHEIQNPLNFVNNFSELSKDLVDEMDNLDSEEDKKEAMRELKDNLQKINHHGNRASDIIKQLQEYTRTGKVHEFFTDEK